MQKTAHIVIGNRTLCQFAMVQHHGCCCEYPTKQETNEAAKILPKGYKLDYTGESRQLRVEGNKFLPAFVLATVPMSITARMTRSSMLDSLGSEYIKLARIKGLSERIVVWKHALRNSLLPVLTYSGTILGRMITGVVVVETVFAWPGIGRLAYESVMSRDFPVLQAVVLLMAALFLGINLVVDVLYAYVDPRIHYS